MQKAHQFVLITVIITLLSAATAISSIFSKEGCPPENECPGDPGAGG